MSMVDVYFVHMWNCLKSNLVKKFSGWRNGLEVRTREQMPRTHENVSVWFFNVRRMRRRLSRASSLARASILESSEFDGETLPC